MNDLQLHHRLDALADELAPDADPYAQAAGARSLHRRQRRTRLTVAGAAVAVALVAVGVPTAVTTLSAPDGDVAAPSATSEPLRGPANAVRTAMAWWEDDGSVPEPESSAPCPDAAGLLSDLDGRYAFEAVRTNTGGTLTGCGWSTDPSSATAAEERIDLMLRAAPDLDADLLVSNLEADSVQDGCSSTTLFPGLSPDVLQVCDRGTQQVWTVTVVDEDGTGAWVVAAAVGTDVDARFTVSASSVAALWGIVSDRPDAEPELQEDELQEDEAALEGMAEALRAELRAVDPVTVPDASRDVPCPAAAETLSRATGMYELAPHAGNPQSRTSDGCRWSLAGSSGSPATDRLDLELRSDPALGQDELTRGYDARAVRDGCYPTALPGSVSFSALLLCSDQTRTSWTVTMLDGDGTGGWVLTAEVGSQLPEAFGTGKGSVLALRGVVVDGL